MQTFIKIGEPQRYFMCFKINVIDFVVRRTDHPEVMSGNPFQRYQSLTQLFKRKRTNLPSPLHSGSSSVQRANTGIEMFSSGNSARLASS